MSSVSRMECCLRFLSRVGNPTPEMYPGEHWDATWGMRAPTAVVRQRSATRPQGAPPSRTYGRQRQLAFPSCHRRCLSRAERRPPTHDGSDGRRGTAIVRYTACGEKRGEENTFCGEGVVWAALCPPLRRSVSIEFRAARSLKPVSHAHAHVNQSAVRSHTPRRLFFGVDK